MRRTLEAEHVPLLDLNRITRSSDLCRTVVDLRLTDYRRHPWIECGESEIRTTHDSRHVLSAHLGEGATDFEEDSPDAFRLQLIGLRLEYVSGHTAWFEANIDPTEEDAFRVPSSDYDPVRHPDTVKCQTDSCRPVGHPIVPEGLYVPPPNPKLFERVAGAHVTIRIGPRWPPETY